MMSVCVCPVQHGSCCLRWANCAQMTDCLFIGLECWNRDERWTDLIVVFTSESELRDSTLSRLRREEHIVHPHSHFTA